MNENEQGFSLIELAVAMAIMVALSGMAYGSLSSTAEAIKTNAEEAQQAQADAFQAQIDAAIN
jgi:prepilin-type N-terminal cleavage/methylation domain-containing protein